MVTIWMWCTLVRAPFGSLPKPQLLSGFPHNISIAVCREGSLVPRPPPFLPSVCVHNNTREWKTGEKRGRPGSIDHVSGREVDEGGEGPIFKYIRTKLESEFLTVQDE